MFKVIQDGLTYTFYEGDQEFSQVEGVVFSARKLASMRNHPARIKHEGRVIWCAETYFAELINKVNEKPVTASKARYKGHTSTGKRLSIDDFQIVGGKR